MSERSADSARHVVEVAGRRRRTALAICALGLALIAIARFAVPAAPPLYDGVVVQEPYRYASPGSGEAGNPTSFTTTAHVTGGSSPPIAAATGENPPQAQLIASAGALAVPAGTTSMTITISPIAPDASASTVRGNVYRVRVTDQGGHDLAAAPNASMTIVLRAPDNVSEPQIVERRGASGWTAIGSVSSGSSGFVDANVSALGDFAITGNLPSGSSGVATPLLALAAGVTLVSALALAYVVRRSRARPDPSPSARGRTGQSPGGRSRRKRQR